MPMDEFAPYLKFQTCFVVQNIGNNPRKTIKIFNYPILYGAVRDLLQIRGVAEQDIRASLLKGTLRNKILNNEITVVCSDIDLLQFNDAQKSFLQAAGIVKGLEVSGGSGSLNYLFRNSQPLIGIQDGSNRTFTVPFPDKFIEGLYSSNQFHIFITHNGHKMELGIDYTISESGGVGTGYDTINFISITPISESILRASYVIPSV